MSRLMPAASTRSTSADGPPPKGQVLIEVSLDNHPETWESTEKIALPGHVLKQMAFMLMSVGQ